MRKCITYGDACPKCQSHQTVMLVKPNDFGIEYRHTELVTVGNPQPALCLKCSETWAVPYPFWHNEQANRRAVRHK